MTVPRGLIPTHRILRIVCELEASSLSPDLGPTLYRRCTLGLWLHAVLGGICHHLHRLQYWGLLVPQLLRAPVSWSVLIQTEGFVLTRLSSLFTAAKNRLSMPWESCKCPSQAFCTLKVSAELRILSVPLKSPLQNVLLCFPGWDLCAKPEEPWRLHRSQPCCPVVGEFISP